MRRELEPLANRTTYEGREWVDITALNIESASMVRGRVLLQDVQSISAIVRRYLGVTGTLNRSTACYV